MYTRLSQRALDRARNEARHLNIGLTDTGHLLLGLAGQLGIATASPPVEFAAPKKIYPSSRPRFIIFSRNW